LLGLARDAAAFVGMGTIVLVRSAAILCRLELPVLTLDEPDETAARRSDGS
jgi:hypothetical protein